MEINRKLASAITTQLEWDHLILENSVKNELTEIIQWSKHAPLILNEWGLKKHLKPGYSALFHGASGTGKTLAAKLIGKETERPVYRIDLSLLVSKYIGETEKNLSKLFKQAEEKNWILYFDEADALFGKRTEVNDAHDRFANQKVSYLLQRMEDFNGLVILAANVDSIADEAFSRRFQSMVYFPNPAVKERVLLWNQLFQNKNWDTTAIDFERLAEHYELTGGEITQVLRYCAIQMASRNETTLIQEDIINGIRRVLQRQHKSIDQG